MPHIPKIIIIINKTKESHLYENGINKEAFVQRSKKILLFDV